MFAADLFEGLVAFEPFGFVHRDVLVDEFVDLFVHVVADASSHDSSVAEYDKCKKN